MRIAIINSNPDEDLSKGIESASNLIFNAKEKQAEVIIFGFNFLKIKEQIEQSKNIIKHYKESAKKADINILTSRIFHSENNKIYSAVAYINSQGKIKGWQPVINLTKNEERYLSPGPMVKCMDTILNKTIALSNFDVFDPVINRQLDSVDCKTLIMQVNPISTLEQEAFRELAIERSMSQANLVIVISLPDIKHSIETFNPASFVVYQGKEITESSPFEDMLIVDIDYDYISDFKLVLQKVEIPKLLEQKFMQENQRGL